jgi:hypothetical protein
METDSFANSYEIFRSQDALALESFNTTNRAKIDLFERGLLAAALFLFLHISPTQFFIAQLL